MAKRSGSVLAFAGGSESGRSIPREGAWRRYATFLRRPPELTVAWRDSETSARGWLVINSGRGGAAGGGTRMRPGLQPREVTYLAKVMELKFALSGPAIGGAKSGIDFDASGAARPAVLERFYRSIEPLLRHRYGTGGDLNVDEALDVIPAFRQLGLRHPQEGIVRGHLRPDSRSWLSIMERLETGVVADVGGDLGVEGLALSVSDMVTGYGVAHAVERYLQLRGRSLAGVRVLLEGFGNVGASCALYLSRAGARIVSISDARSVLRDPDGVDAAGIEELIRTRRNKMLPADDPRVVAGDPQRFWQDADVFVCAAISESITRERLDRLAAHGVRIVGCGANQPFREAKIGSTRVAQHADRRFAVLADIVSNCGMARAFSYLMERGAHARAVPIFDAVRATITSALDEVMDRSGNQDHALLASTLEMALDRVESPAASD